MLMTGKKKYKTESGVGRHYSVAIDSSGVREKLGE